MEIIDEAAINRFQLEKLSLIRAHSIYGRLLPAKVTERLETEIIDIIAANAVDFFIECFDRVMNGHDHINSLAGAWILGPSLTAHYLGLTDVNPLPPHYYCNCGFSDFGVHCEDFFPGDVATDLKSRVCPVCGASLEKDGYDIPWNFETMRGILLDPECKRKLFEEQKVHITDDKQQLTADFLNRVISGIAVRNDNMSDKIRIKALGMGTNVLVDNADILLKDTRLHLSLHDLVCSREDVMTHLLTKGIAREKAVDIMECVRKGRAGWEFSENNYDIYMRAHGVPEYYIQNCQRIVYIVPKAVAIYYALREEK